MKDYNSKPMKIYFACFLSLMKSAMIYFPYLKAELESISQFLSVIGCGRIYYNYSSGLCPIKERVLV